MKKQYTEKEICVFGGVMALSKDGKKIYNITVQDIAKASNMGKGTLYEYFSSKEEIIINALMYFLGLENQKAEKIAFSKMSFKEKIYALYDLLLKSFEDGFAAVSQFVTSDEMLNIPKIIHDQQEYIEEVMTLRNELVMTILQQGVEEGVISLDFDADYIRMAIMANLSCLNTCIHLPAVGLNVCQIEQKKDHAYTILLKTLN
ncbi:MAG: TetR/AcrR family transcriptional regulator [Oscillospiraceae bacterium]|nr:TetR/AcrR family transcriptional regulator [Oscillospiraceae bacterium]